MGIFFGNYAPLLKGSNALHMVRCVIILLSVNRLFKDRLLDDRLLDDRLLGGRLHWLLSFVLIALVVPLPPFLEREDGEILVSQMCDFRIVTAHPSTEIFQIVGCRTHASIAAL